jgi:sugar phosphate isomerase/epimerase
VRLNLFSISYAGLWGQDSLPLDDFIGKAASLGYDGVMLAGKRPHLSVLDTDDRRIDQLRHQLTKYNVSCDVIGAYTDFTMSSSELPSTELQISYLEQLARIAQQLDTKVVRVFTAYEKPTEAPLACWRRLTGIFQEACDRVAEFGVTPALLEFLADIDRPNCKLGFDAWSPALRGEDLYEAAKLAAPHTVITTNADYVRFPQFQYRPELVNYSRNDVDMVRAVPFGEGFIDFGAFFAGLTEGGFDGIATYEMCSPLRGGGSVENLDHCATRFLNWMSEHNFTGESSSGSQSSS